MNQEPDSRVLKLLKTLATPIRLRLLVLLSRHKSGIALPLILAELMPQRASTSNVCEQLQLLMAEGLIRTDRIGRKVFYRVNGEEVRKAVEVLEGLARITGGDSGHK